MAIPTAVVRAQVYTSAFLDFESMKGTFSPTTSTLVLGSKDAVLIDAQHIRRDVAALGDMIARAERRLTTIYVTHGHADHWYGAGELANRFPGVRSLATAGVVDYMNESAEQAAGQWSAMFGDRVSNRPQLPKCCTALCSTSKEPSFALSRWARVISLPAR